MNDQQSILLVEDDVVDVMTVKRALKQLEVASPLHVSGNGEEALEFLRDPGTRLPEIILLDINMPRMNGIEFLEVVKQEEGLKTIPVIVLTTSVQERDRLQSFDLGVAGYMLKPVDYPQFVEVMRTVHQYWSISQLP